MSSYVHDLRDWAKQEGWTLERSGGGHFKLRKEGVPGYLTAAFSPRNGQRSLNQVKAQAKRMLAFRRVKA